MGQRKRKQTHLALKKMMKLKVVTKTESLHSTPDEDEITLYARDDIPFTVPHSYTSMDDFYDSDDPDYDSFEIPTSPARCAHSKVLDDQGTGDLHLWWLKAVWNTKPQMPMVLLHVIAS